MGDSSAGKAIWPHPIVGSGRGGRSLILVGLGVLGGLALLPASAAGQVSKPVMARAEVVRSEVSGRALATARSIVAGPAPTSGARVDVGVATITVTPQKPADARTAPAAVASIQFLRN